VPVGFTIFVFIFGTEHKEGGWTLAVHVNNFLKENLKAESGKRKPVRVGPNAEGNKHGKVGFNREMRGICEKMGSRGSMGGRGDSEDVECRIENGT
jgi:hypothetical protein